MTIVKLLHNAKAGDEEHSCEALVSLIKSKGFSCGYASVKERGWHKIDDETDFLIIAGGDGTVRRVVEKLLDRKLIDKKFPMAILPLGTANNLAKTLQVETDTERAIESWRSFKKRPFDVGKIFGLKGKKFFLEGMGYGVFPHLMKRMEEPKNSVAETPEKKLEIAMKLLHEIVLSYKTSYCEIIIDGADHSGDYLMVEILNIRSIGPNLYLGPDVVVDDGEFDVVLVAKEQRNELASYVLNKIKGKEIRPDLNIIKGRNIQIEWHGNGGHIDDKRIKIKNPEKIKIEIQKSLLEFLIR